MNFYFLNLDNITNNNYVIINVKQINSTNVKYKVNIFILIMIQVNNKKFGCSYGNIWAITVCLN